MTEVGHETHQRGRVWATVADSEYRVNRGQFDPHNGGLLRTKSWTERGRRVRSILCRALCCRVFRPTQTQGEGGLHRAERPMCGSHVPFRAGGGPGGTVGREIAIIGVWLLAEAKTGGVLNGGTAVIRIDKHA